MGSIKRLFPLVLFLPFSFFPLFPQNSSPGMGEAVSLGSEISRLEMLAQSSGSSAQGPSIERYRSFLNLVQLYRLSGNTDAALKCVEEALMVFPGDGRLLNEQGRLLISVGEYERAVPVINTLLLFGHDHEFFLQGRYLGALLEAFGKGNVQPLAGLAEENTFSLYRGQIYYSLWILTGLPSWKTRLSAEYPLSPEAKIASGDLSSAPTPLWLLFPGRNNVSLSGASVQNPSIQNPSIQSTSGSSPPPIQTGNLQASPASSVKLPVRVLQTGLFSSEENAAAMVERLMKAGFESGIYRRQVNGKDFWAAGVSFGADMNATILKLKNAGFESFPVTIP